MWVGIDPLSDFDIDISQVKRLVELVQAHDLEELTVEEGDLSITVKGRAARTPAPVPAHHTTHAQPSSPADVHHEEAVEEEIQAEPEEELEGNIVDIAAPLVGVFYRAPSPDAANFVEVGDVIEVGSEVGLIEAMKVFSSIPSEVAGEVVAIPVDNGKLVQQGEVLVRVRASEEQT